MNFFLIFALLYVFYHVSNVERIANVFAKATMDVQGRLSPNGHLADFSNLSPDTRVVLDHGQQSTYLKKDGSFTIKNVPSGVYIFEVASNEYAFDRYWIDVDAENKIVRPSKWVPGTQYEPSSKLAIPYPLELFALGKYGYFTPREKFNWFSMLQNPMILMPLVAIGAMYVMPKMMEGLDPEELKEVQETQRKILNGATGANTPNFADMLAQRFAGPQQAQTSPKDKKKK